MRMQLDALKTAQCDRIFTDHGISGARSSRPGLDRLLGYMKPGDTVIVYKLDRLGRSVLHLSDLLVRFHAEGIHFCSLSEGINTATPGGKLVYHVFSAFAEFQRDIIVENTIEGMRAAKRRGRHVGRPRSLRPADVKAAHRDIRQSGARPKDIAKQLGVSPLTLSRAIKRLGLDEAA